MKDERRNVQFRHILIGYDGSPGAEGALEAGLSIARNAGSAVEVLAVAFPPEPPTTAKLEAIMDDAHAQYDKALGRIADAARENGIHLETDIAIGHPAEQIIRRAEQSHADLIIVGRRGVSTVRRLVMGSVSERVLHYAPCPVLVTRPDANGDLSC